MSALATLGGTGVSLAALGYLAATDPKRRRAFRLPTAKRRRAGLAWAAALLAGALVPVWSGGGGFLIWFGATTVTGWGLAAISPERVSAWRLHVETAVAAFAARSAPIAVALERTGRRVAGATAALRPRQGSDRIDALEQRVAELEAEVVALRRHAPTEAHNEGVVVELARPVGRR